jgi:predicted dehydrogenase
MTDHEVRWGVLGTGGIAQKFAEDLARVPGARLAAVGSRTPAGARAFAERHGFARAHGSWAELAADDDVDVVYVATPHSAHHAAALTCLRAGRAVLCEKPFTLDLPTSTELVETARARGVFLMEAMWTRFNPAILDLLALLADGAIGEVTSVHADFGLAGPFDVTHRLRARELGGGALLDLGIYPITLAHLVLGRPDHVRAWSVLSPAGVDENTGILFGYDSGAVAALTCGIVGETRNGGTITGRAGRIELPAGFHRPTTVTLHRTGRDPEVRSFAIDGWGYQFEAQEVHRCLAAGQIESSVLPHRVTLEVMGLLDQIRAIVGVSYA